MADNLVFTEREMTLLSNAMLCLKSDPEIDFEKLTPRLNMTNSKSARNAWAALKKKIAAAGSASDGGVTPAAAAAAATPKKGGKKTAAATAHDEGENGSDGEPKSAPKKASPKKRGAKPKDGEGSPKKKGKKSKADASDSAVEDAAEAVKLEQQDAMAGLDDVI